MSEMFIYSEGIIHPGGVIGKTDASVSGTLTWRLNHLENELDLTNTKLDNIFIRLNDGTNHPYVGKITNTSFAAITDGAYNPLRLDRFARVITSPVVTSVGTNQSLITKRGARAVNSKTLVALDNTSAVPAGFSSQDINYTVPTGTKFLLCSFDIVPFLPPSNVTWYVTILVNGVEVLSSWGTGGAGGNTGTELKVPYECPQDAVITINVASTANVTLFVTYTGVQESL